MSSARPALVSQPAAPERFVSAEEAARFLSVTRRYVLELARKGIAGAYAIGTGNQRKVWVFRLSELAESITRKEITAPIHKIRKLCDPAHGSLR
jgi:excisionase family DNA binding protein